jgi:O-antigen/teichoic acid export membrane protein
LVSLSISLHHDEAPERLQRGTAQLLLAKGCFFVSAYVMSAILARNLGAAEYGIYGVVISVLFWLEMLVYAGVPGATAKLMADSRHDPNAVERSARALLVGLSLLLFGVCWLLAPGAASLMRIANGEILFRIVILDLPFAALYASYDGILYGRRTFGVIAIAQVVYAASKIGGVVALVGLGFSLERVLLVNVLSTCVVCAVLTVRCRPHGFKPKRGIMAEISVIAMPMAVYLVAGQVLVNMDLWSLKSLWEGEGEIVGQYVASMNLAKILTVIPAAQAGVLFTSVAWAIASRDTARARRHIREASRFALIVAAVSCVVLGSNGSELLAVIFSDVYAEGQRFLWFQLVAFGLFGLLDIFCHSLMAIGRQYLAAGTLVAIAPLAWLSNYVLIPQFGPLGAAASMLLGIVVGTCLTGAMAYRHFGVFIPFSTVLRVLVAVLIVGLLSEAINVRGPLIMMKLAILGSFYVFLLYVLGEITKKDLWRSRTTAQSGA